MNRVEWKNHYKIISCYCGKYIIVDLPISAPSEVYKEKYGHFVSKKEAERYAGELFSLMIIEKEMLT